jgi:hypothetical protein
VSPYGQAGDGDAPHKQVPASTKGNMGQPCVEVFECPRPAHLRIYCVLGFLLRFSQNRLQGLMPSDENSAVQVNSGFFFAKVYQFLPPGTERRW